MQTLTIGELARSAGVGVETIRFYEREGLLAEPERRPSGYRQYPAEVADVEKRVAAMQAIKATLERLVRSCRGKGPRDDCPILAVLDREEESHARG